MESVKHKPENVILEEETDRVVILDQTKLPGQREFIELKTAGDFYDAIFQLKVRGAPAIGICAGFGMYVLAKQIEADSYVEFIKQFRSYKDYLDSARPTAVNLGWALNRMDQIVENSRERTREELLDNLKQECIRIQQEDILMCRSISGYGLSVLKDGDGILTHCNAGPLATSCYGTALGPILLGTERGMHFRVFADETRPLLQGARLTTYELSRAGVDVTLICDNMAGLVMKNGWIQACLVGCDRVAANGDTANKIGTCSAAILASYYKVPFYVLGPTSTIDLKCKTGEDINIELRDPSEIKEKFYREAMAPPDVKCYNPAFDITDHDLISGIITEYGICRAPYTESLRNLFS